MFKSVSLFCFFLIATISQVYAMSAEQKSLIHEQFERVGMLCMKDHAVTEEDINQLTARKIADGPNVPCFLACMFKALGVMDVKGMLEKETALEHAKKIFNDPEELKLIEDYLHSCSHINTEAVNDGEKGCERAALSYKCMTENASQFGLDL